MRSTGACQSATREFFFYARGYDEAFVHWGSEDTDMRDRALGYGLELRWISDQTEMFHQWHPTSRYSRLLQNRKNALRYFGRVTGNTDAVDRRMLSIDVWSNDVRRLDIASAGPSASCPSGCQSPPRQEISGSRRPRNSARRLDRSRQRTGRRRDPCCR